MISIKIIILLSATLNANSKVHTDKEQERIAIKTEKEQRDQVQILNYIIQLD